jgi:hypothetical protein
MSQDSRPRSIIGPLNIYSILVLAGVVGPLVFVIADLVAAFFVESFWP